MMKIVFACTSHLIKNFKRFVRDLFARIKDRLQNYIAEVHGDFYSLGPSDEVVKGKESLRALEWALKNQKIHNIALTGNYGSGKSSIINAYINKHPGARSIHLSLASFFTEKTEESTCGLGVDEKKIEESILKQLFYKVNYRMIPQSRYRKLHKAKNETIFFRLLCGLLLLCGFIYFFLPELYQKGMEQIRRLAAFHQIGIAKMWIIVIFFAGVCYVAAGALLCKILSGYVVKELNIMDKASLSARDEKETSIFNKNMDEIMYFFEVTKYNIVFIEDLDRFNNVDIFIKLRELNDLLNKNENIHRRIVFVYAVRDDLFIKDDRIKFFDFIIPVIPIINATNSNEVLLEWQQKNESAAISTEFIIKISPYIGDMRMLHNIMNEFMIYRKTLIEEQKLSLQEEKLFSLMVYKNLFPKDFSELQNERGIIKQAFGEKEAYLRQQKNSADEPDNQKNITMREFVNDYVDELSETVRENKLAVFMLRNGYIEEDYAGYINYFYPNNITDNDMNFILSIRNFEKKDPEYSLNNIDQVVKRITEREFAQKEILNYQLLDFLLENKLESQKCITFIKQLANGTNLSKNFILDFIDKGIYIRRFMNQLCKYYNNFWHDISHDPISDDQRNRLFELIIRYVDLEDIEKMNESPWYHMMISKRLENRKNILIELKNIEPDKLKEVISGLHIKFVDLECEGVDDNLLSFVFDNNYYEINASMISNVIGFVSPENLENLENAHYTTILRTDYKPLIDYIDRDFAFYVKEICLQQENNLSEKCAVVVNMISKLRDAPDLCVKLIEKENILIDNIELCYKERTIWRKLLDTRKVQMSIDNIVCYWKNYGLCEELIEYLNVEMKRIAELAGVQTLPEKLIADVLTSELEIEAYSLFISKYKIDNLKSELIGNIEQKRMQLLLKKQYWNLHPELLEQIRIVYPELVWDVLITYKTVILNKAEDYAIKTEEAGRLLNEADLTDEEIIIILTRFDADEVSDEAAERIIRVASHLSKKAAEKAWRCLPKDKRLRLLYEQRTIYTKNEFSEKFKEMGEPYLDLADRSRSHYAILNNTDDNRYLMKYLTSIKYLISIRYMIIAGEKKIICRVARKAD